MSEVITMRIIKRVWMFVFVLCLSASPLWPGSSLAQSPERRAAKSGDPVNLAMSAEQRAAFRAARTVRVISEISYKEATDIKILARGAISPTAFTQPFEEIARATLEPSGVRLVSGGSGAAADLTFRVRGSFEETLNSLTLQFGGGQASMQVGGLGARWQGTLTVSAPNVPDYAVSFAGQAQSPDRQSKEYLDRQYDQMEITMHVSKGALEAMLAYGSYAFAVTEVMGQAHGSEPLLASLNNTERHAAFRAAAARTLGTVNGEGTLERLLEALKDKVPLVRAGAAEGLGRLGDGRALQPLLEALRQPDETLQASAATALGMLGDQRAIEPLIEATLKNASEKVSEIASEALGQLGGASAVDALISSLQDKSATTRRRAIRALGRLRDPRAVEPLTAAAKDQDPGVREAAVLALGQSKDQRSVGALLEALKDPVTTIRSAAATALGQSRDARVVEPLLAALTDTNASVRSSVIKALGETGDRRAGPRLLPILQEKDASIRQVAAESLRLVCDASCVEPLIAALKDKEARVRAAVAAALAQLTDQRFGEDRKQWEKWWKQNKKASSPTP
jgi:HEAT repeat protein